MILVKNRLILGAIKRIIVGVLKAVYAVFALFNLQLTVLCLLIGVVLYFTGVFENRNVLLIIYYFVLIASIVLAIVLTIRRLLGLSGDGKKQKRRKPDIVKKEKPTREEQYEEQPVESKAVVTPPAEERAVYRESAVSAQAPTPPKYPKYYGVRQNPNYVMAEYEDRYELFLKSREGLKKIRTDYKNTEK